MNLELNTKQTQFFTATHKHFSFIGGRGSGKTHVGSEWATYKVLSNPQTVGLICANSYKQLSQSTLPPFLFALNKHGFVEGKHFVYNKMPRPDFIIYNQFPKYDGIISFANGASIITKSLENYDDLRGVEYGWYWLDESRDTREEAFKVVLGGLRHKASKKLEGRITSTPNGFDWMYKNFVSEPDPKYGYVQSSSWENRHNLPDGYIDDLMSSYDLDYAQQEIYGKFLNIFAGKVYLNFERKEHVSFDAIYRDDLPLIFCFDFNVNPMSTVICQFYKGIIYVIDEIVISDADTPKVCEEFLNRYGFHKKEILIYGDATGKRGTAGITDYKVIAEKLKRHQISFHVPNDNPDIIDRVNAVKAKLKNANGKIGLYINPKCKALIMDLEQVSFKKGTRVFDKSKQMLTHSSDALGYFIEKEFSLKRNQFIPMGR